MFPIGLGSFSELFSGYTLYLIIGISLINGALLFFASSKFLLVMQQSGYRGKRYFKWLLNPETPYLSRLMLLCLLGLLFFCLLSVCFLSVVGNTITSYMGFLSYVLFVSLYIDSERNVNAKLPLKKTKRLVRLCITYEIILTLLTFGIIVLVNFIAYSIGDEVVGVLRYAPICLIPLLSPYVLFLAYLINEPFENAIKKHIVLKATAKLDSADVIKIGITGSFGKTSVKEILNTVLSQKFRVLSTPNSFNTPMGIALTVKGLDSTHDIFIAEMGARNKGDIKELADMIKPSVAVLTGINNQHLESFGSIETIKNTKFELFEGLTENGVGFFSSESEGAKELFNRFNGEKYSAGINKEGNFAYATDITTDERGMSFNLHINGEKPVKCCTVLLGRHSVSNICLAAAVAYKIGLTPEEIAMGVNRIPALKHRLELLPNNKNIVIIDDSYNSNEDGIRAAMEVLDTFSGRKIVLTPGLVELGKMENVVNLEFGKTLARHADLVIVIGKHNAEMLISGLTDGGFNKENILFAKSLNKANVLLNGIVKEGDFVLFENDLPDNYN
ncbi:MAG: UDP-N-acetylmuramoyl-tripeptide--D-alanyl-D-alanine ligase [Clostridia bacterium]|nr:UDP-N-acetylmuramoyl-tripeptide--D-alanyl-D-alanine ligase [Clostridia bacterium]